MHFTALVTPFNEDMSIDIPSFELLFERQNLTNGVVIAGSTGEGRSLSFDEKIILTKHALRLKNDKNFQIILSHSYDTGFKKNDELINDLDISAILITPPTYCKPSQSDIINFYQTITNNITKPIIIYNNPSRVGVDINDETMMELLKLPSIVGVKESSPDFRKINKIANNSSKVPIMCGEDAYVDLFYAQGAKGWISVIGNIAPNDCQQLHENLFMNKENKKIITQILNLVDCLNFACNPVAVKSVLSKLNLIKNILRFPLNSVIIEEEKIIPVLQHIENLKKAKLVNINKNYNETNR